MSLLTFCTPGNLLHLAAAAAGRYVHLQPILPVSPPVPCDLFPGTCPRTFHEGNGVLLIATTPSETFLHLLKR